MLFSGGVLWASGGKCQRLCHSYVLLGNYRRSMAAHGKKKHSTFHHLCAGGIGGTVGAVLTSPFDVVKTRLQSSGFRLRKVKSYGLNMAGSGGNFNNTQTTRQGFAVLSYMRYMIRSEGWLSLYRGVEVHLLGTAPARAIYFATYSKTKHFIMTELNYTIESPVVPVASAMVAGLTTCTLTNPVWFLKTRLQLESTHHHPGGNIATNIVRTVQNIYRNEGWQKFYSGLSASYLGVTETMINFLIYEQLKLHISKFQKADGTFNPLTYLIAAGVAKTTASIIGYPHEVLRTRLRQQSNTVLGTFRYKSIIQTAMMIGREEGLAAFYGGLGTHLMRQVPNQIILFLTYEAIIHYLEQGS